MQEAGSRVLGRRPEGQSPNAPTCAPPFTPALSCNTLHPLNLMVQPQCCLSLPPYGLKRVLGCPATNLGLARGGRISPQVGGE